MVFLAFLILASFATPAAFGLAAFNIYQNTKEVFPLVLFTVLLLYDDAIDVAWTERQSH